MGEPAGSETQLEEVDHCGVLSAGHFVSVPVLFPSMLFSPIGMSSIAPETMESRKPWARIHLS